jgi:heptosyltransferase-2
MSQITESLLIVGPSWVGDMVMSQSLFRLLKMRDPHCRIDVLAPPWSAPILQCMPEVDGIIAKPIGHGELALRRRWRLGRELRTAGYTRAIVLPNSFKSALVPYFAGIERRTGWRGEWRYGLLNDVRVLDADALPLMVQRFVALALAPGEALPNPVPAPQLSADPEAAAATASEFGIEVQRPLLALCPGAEFGAAKRWPQEHFAALAKPYLARGWQLALLGSNKDAPVTAAIAAQLPAGDVFDLAGRTSLAQAVDCLALASAVVSNDSGLMHIAAALDRPTVVVYGATSPGFTPPLSANAAWVASDIDCAPCFQRECPLGHHRCMRDTTPQQVAAKLAQIVESA